MSLLIRALGAGSFSVCCWRCGWAWGSRSTSHRQTSRPCLRPASTTRKTAAERGVFCSVALYSIEVHQCTNVDFVYIHRRLWIWEFEKKLEHFLSCKNNCITAYKMLWQHILCSYLWFQLEFNTCSKLHHNRGARWRWWPIGQVRTARICYLWCIGTMYVSRARAHCVGLNPTKQCTRVCCVIDACRPSRHYENNTRTGRAIILVYAWLKISELDIYAFTNCPTYGWERSP